MVRLIIVLALVAGFIVLYRSLFGSPRLHDPSDAAEMVQDPNCGVYVPKSQTVTRSVRGKGHCFCSERCANEYSTKYS